MDSFGIVCSFLYWESATLFQLWLALSLLSFLSLTALSTICFFLLYCRPTFEMWRYKINPIYPPVTKVREEIIVMTQGLLFSTICPALSLYMTRLQRGYGYCGVDSSNGGWLWIFSSFIIIWFLTDFYEWLYHWCGHRFQTMWSLHKGHHCFYNPTPFAVIADNPIDQLLRSAPLLFFPMMFPINIELLFGMFSLVFFANGLIQHCGYELYILEWIGIDGHSRWFLSSYHHYLHHAKSSMNSPLYNGQLLQVWDHLAGSATYVSPAINSKMTSNPTPQDILKSCLCSKCAREKGLRSEKEWKRISASLPDYSLLLSPSFWLLEPSKEDSVRKS